MTARNTAAASTAHSSRRYAIRRQLRTRSRHGRRDRHGNHAGRQARADAGGGRSASPSDCRGHQRENHQQFDHVVAEPVADDGAGGPARVLKGSAGAEHGDRDGRVQVQAQGGAEGGQPGDAPAVDGAAAPQRAGHPHQQRRPDHHQPRQRRGHRGDDPGEGEPLDRQPGQGDEQAAQQSGYGDSGAAQQHAGGEGVADQEDQYDHPPHPAKDTQPVPDDHGGVQAGGTGRDRDHRPHRRGGPPPGR